MFKKKTNRNELAPPPVAFDDPDAVEVMRVWAVPSLGQQFVINPIWKDAGAFGLLLADVANQAANAYANRDGVDRKTALNRIMELFMAEMESPTDPYDEVKEN